MPAPTWGRRLLQEPAAAAGKVAVAADATLGLRRGLPAQQQGAQQQDGAGCTPGACTCWHSR